MKDYQLAWKNIWRNRRRTLITAASVFFAVFFALVMRSFQLGAYDRLFKNVIESYTGYLQLQHIDYFDDPNIDNSFEIDQGVIVLGIDPQEEDKVMSVKGKLVKYRLTPEVVESLQIETLPDKTKKLLDLFTNESYSSDARLMLDLSISDEDSTTILPVIRRQASFKNDYLGGVKASEVLIGDGLSEYLKAGVSDTIVLFGQGYHGTTAAGKYVVKGIIKLPSPDIDNVIVYIPIETARELYAASGMATSAVISLKSNSDDDISETGNRLKNIISEPMTIKTWQELNALLVNQMEADNRSGMIMIAVIYLVIAFGVFGTVLMMMAERRREFGMLVSIGMKKGKLAKVVSFEMLFIGLIGVVAGVIVSLPLVFYGNMHPLRFTGEFARMYEDYGFEPVMPTMLPDTFYIWQVVVVLIILVIAISFSTRKIFKLNVINALRA
jgi:putative ABC transport system permease protein